MTFFDTHAHIFKEYYSNIDETIRNSTENNVKYILIPATSLEDSKEVLNTCKKHNNVYAAVGIHPEFANEYTDSKKIYDHIQKLEQLINENDKIVAIGEIGLDNHWTKEFKKEQKALLIAQIDLANKLNLPVILHIRESTNEILEILKENPVKKGGIFHSISFNEHLIKEGLKLGFHISFSGTVTFKNAKPNESITIVPDDKLLIETDSPYLTPHPYRGKQNNPIFVKLIAEKLAEIRNVSLDHIAKISTNNALKLFKIDN